MLEVAHLQVRYGAVRAVKGVSFSVGAGEMVCLLGANGSGKTTTLLTVAGALKPHAGRIVFNGENITALPPEQVLRRGIAMVPETRDVFPDLTVQENLRLGGFIHRGSRKETARDMDRMMALFPVLKERRDQAGGTLSGGEQQQLVIARAMMARPRLLLLDEPSLGLAPAIVDHIFQFIGRLKRTGLTLLLVEQNAGKALQAADRAYVMALGEIAAAGRAEAIAGSSNLEALYLGA